MLQVLCFLSKFQPKVCTRERQDYSKTRMACSGQDIRGLFMAYSYKCWAVKCYSSKIYTKKSSYAKLTRPKFNVLWGFFSKVHIFYKACCNNGLDHMTALSFVLYQLKDLKTSILIQYFSTHIYIYICTYFHCVPRVPVSSVSTPVFLFAYCVNPYTCNTMHFTRFRQPNLRQWRNRVNALWYAY